MIRYVALSIALLLSSSCASAQYAAPAAGYGAPAASSGYAAPDAGYGAPTGGASYAAPATGYDAAAPAYDYAPPAAAGYAAPAAGYAAAPAPAGFDPSALLSFIIPILVVIGLIIAAIIIGGGILSLITSGTTLSLGGLAPLINALLNPLGLSLCTTTPLAIFNGNVGGGRMLTDLAAGYGFDVSEETMNVVADFATSAFEMAKSEYYLPFFIFAHRMTL
jgi:hypothetical protein